MRHTLILLLACVLLAATGCATRTQVKKAISEDPEMLMQVLKENRFELLELIQATLKEQADLARQEQVRQDAQADLKPVIQGNRLIEGAVSAPVTIVEYSDFQCPYCVNGHMTMNELMKRHPDVVRVVYKHNPIKKGSFGLAALYEAVVQIDPDKAVQFKDLLFANQKALHDDKGDGTFVAGLLKSLDLDPKEVDRLARSEEIAELIKADATEVASFGLEGTPMFVVGGMPVRGAVPIETFEQVIQLVLTRQAGDCVDCVQ